MSEQYTVTLHQNGESLSLDAYPTLKLALASVRESWLEGDGDEDDGPGTPFWYSVTQGGHLVATLCQGRNDAHVCRTWLVETEESQLHCVDYRYDESGAIIGVVVTEG